LFTGQCKRVQYYSTTTAAGAPSLPPDARIGVGIPLEKTATVTGHNQPTVATLPEAKNNEHNTNTTVLSQEEADRQLAMQLANEMTTNDDAAGPTSRYQNDNDASMHLAAQQLQQEEAQCAAAQRRETTTPSRGRGQPTPQNRQALVPNQSGNCTVM